MRHTARSSIRSGIAPLFLLAFAACSPHAARSAPAPVPSPAAEALGESEAVVRTEARPVSRDLLGSVAYDLPVEANSWVEAELDFLIQQRREVIARWLERGDGYEGFIKRVLAERGVPTDLYHLAMIESGFIPTARSRAGAVGLWQFMPATARGMGLRVDSQVDERMDPVRSTDAAARHLKSLYGIYNDWSLAAAAYNAGSGRISRGMQNFGASNFWELAAIGDLATETKHYVPRLYATTIIARDRTRFGYAPATGSGEFGVDSVAVEYATPLSELAKIGELPVEALTRLNPHLLRQSAPADYLVWVPAGSGARVQQAYLASEFRAQKGLGSYTVRPGDNLSKLAERSGVSRARIRELNPAVNFEKLKIGQTLRLPYGAAQALAARPVAEPAPEPARVARPAARSSESVAATAASTSPATSRPTSEPAAAGVEHTVAQGESLWSIARKYGISVAELERTNSLGGSTIRPGQELRIPVASAAAAPAAPKTVEHVVRAGETLWAIARQYGCSVDSIQSANQLSGAAIVPGQKLRIPQAGA